MKFTKKYLEKLSKNINNYDFVSLNKIINCLSKLKKKQGRLFILGVGGSAANASHAVNDFRKICEIETYTPTDNVSELTARINDEGWQNSFVSFLKISNFNSKDILMIFSVGGGNFKKKISTNLIKAVDFALKKKANIISLCGKKDGYAQKKSTYSFVLPDIDTNLITPFAETSQAIIWHLIVSHPLIKKNKTTW